MLLDRKKVEEAAKRCFNTATKGITDKDEALIAFKCGAHWAIQEFLKDLWHDASEVPENRALLVELKIGKYIISMYSQEVKLFCKKWCYLSDILPKQKGGSK